jgi:hypothetical protein
VENLVGYAKRDLMIPEQPSRTDLTAANSSAAAWCQEVNAATHSEICAIPAERLETERALLGSLPQLRCDIGPRPSAARSTSCPASGSPRPATRSNRLIGSQVVITVVDARVQVLEAFTGEVVAEHALVAPGETSIGGPRASVQLDRPDTA